MCNSTTFALQHSKYCFPAFYGTSDRQAAIFFWTHMIQTWSSFSLVDPCLIFFCFSVKPKFFTPTHVIVWSWLLWNLFVLLTDRRTTTKFGFTVFHYQNKNKRKKQLKVNRTSKTHLVLVRKLVSIVLLVYSQVYFSWTVFHVKFYFTVVMVSVVGTQITHIQ